MRLGDYIVFISMALNFSAACAYGAQGHWWNVLYWAAAFALNLSLVNLK